MQWKHGNSAAFPHHDQHNPGPLAVKLTKHVMQHPSFNILKSLNGCLRLEGVGEMDNVLFVCLCNFVCVDRKSGSIYPWLPSKTWTKFPEKIPVQLVAIHSACSHVTVTSTVLIKPLFMFRCVCVYACLFMSKGLSHNNGQLSLSRPASLLSL